MIDTVILHIPKEKITPIVAPRQGESAWDLQAKSEGYEKYKKNPTAQQLRSGYYFPRLTGYRRMDSSGVNIEFSAPKLIYFNNVDESTENQFEMTVNILQERIKEMGFNIDKETLIDASVSAVHYSKNIILSQGYTSQFVIGELKKINPNKRFDLTKAKYTNDGEILYVYSTSHSFVIYDKIADISRGKKRATDKDQTEYQKNLVKHFGKGAEILRLEVRLSQKRKMISLFKELGFSEKPTFRDVFSSKKSKTILLHYWSKFIEKNAMFLFAYSMTPQDILKQLSIARPKAKPKQLLYSVGLLNVARDGGGLRDIRGLLEKRSVNRTWQRINDDFREVASEMQNVRPREWYDQVKQQLNDFIPYRINRFLDM